MLRIVGWARNKLLLLLAPFSLIVFLAQVAGEISTLQAQQSGWAEPINISDTSSSSWFPDMAVDDQGNVHVVWCETTHVEWRGESEQILYTRWDGREWLEPNDIVAPEFFIHRNAIAVGPSGDLLMVYLKQLTAGQTVHFTKAPVEQAWSAAAWSSPQVVGAHAGAYMSDLSIDQLGRIHLVFDDRGDGTGELCGPSACADILYRRSENGGRTWTAPVNLSKSPIGSGREQIEIDSSSVIHVAWDEGWDRLSGIGDPLYSAYSASFDGGLSWSNPLTITYPMTTTVPLTTTTATSGTAQLTVGADGQGGVMLVWRNTAYWEIFYQWSTDYGKTWATPGIIPGVFARFWTSPFDLYDMTADSAGHTHLLITGSQSPRWDAPLGVYHLVWDGNAWSDPVQVYSGPGDPEYPRLVISEGNHLHAVWGVRDEEGRTLAHYDVWYSESYSAAPSQTPVPLTPMATSMPGPTATPTLVPSPYPTISSGAGGLPDGLYTENDEVLRLLIAVSPVFLIVLLAVVFRKMRR